MRTTLALLAAVQMLLGPRAADARVFALVVEQRRSFAGGTSWGTTGPYERLDGTAYMEVDPRDPLNAVIVNLDRAPRNKSGMVEFSAPFLILKPVDMANGNHKIFYGVNNRGNANGFATRTFPQAPANNNPLTAADAGDGLLLRLGYAFVDAGWQGDVAPGNNRLFPNLPVATQPDGSPIVSAVRIEYSDRTIPAAGTFTLTLEGNPAFRSYETADMNTGHSTLTVRDEVNGPKMPIASSRWAFGSCPGGQATLAPSASNLCVFDGFRADKIYELIYPARNPMVMGLAYAVTRDIGSFLRYQTHDDVGNPNPLALSATAAGIRRAYGAGSSSTGMYMRDWLYQGFNEDESHRKVFDAVHINVPGSHRLFANVEFADPNTYSDQDDRHDFLSTSLSPVTYAVRTDPISGVRDGILKRPATDPLVFQTVTELEFWQFRASLDVADGVGNRVRTPDNVRLYFNTSFSHLGVVGLFGAAGAPGRCQNLTNIFPGAAPTLRALLIALDAWADQGIEPPKSNYPHLAGGDGDDDGNSEETGHASGGSATLVSIDEARASFPAIPGVNFPTVMNELEVLNFGPMFSSVGGRLTVLPPLRGASYRLFVPKPDMDGLGVAGIRPMEIRVPLGTNTGWNVRAPGARAPNLCGLNGSFIPFAKTKAERLATGDPRKSLEERYQDHAGFVKAVRKAAMDLVHDRFLLQEDANTWIKAAEASNVLR